MIIEDFTIILNDDKIELFPTLDFCKFVETIDLEKKVSELSPIDFLKYRRYFLYKVRSEVIDFKCPRVLNLLLQFREPLHYKGISVSCRDVISVYNSKNVQSDIEFNISIPGKERNIVLTGDQKSDIAKIMSLGFWHRWKLSRALKQFSKRQTDLINIVLKIIGDKIVDELPESEVASQ